MQSTRRAIVPLVTAAHAFAGLAGCKPGDEEMTWVYDFMTDGDEFLSADPDWYVDPGDMGETGNGYWLNQASIATPRLFTGDFVAEFGFYLKIMPDDSLFRYAFRLVDPGWDIPTPPSARYFSFAPHYTASPPDVDRYCEIARGNGDYSSQSLYQTVPGIRLNDINTCRLVRAGNVITTCMNGTLVDTETIDAANQPVVGYAPLARGHGSTDVADSNFFIRKLTVTCLPGEGVDHVR